ncbi:PREDICTED: histidine triad nucleotide-binding protein 3-like [Diuraphis noxia]|uniref:histidine triad nucleotide-binding protein 3-like n=1 Tax=Diuraphis noxia TaxID=143948 RepID=UPI000763A2DE|nr:PREDICTED: histidine triad nucleotide-binding protein 3-like [Diuraphis noxia]
MSKESNVVETIKTRVKNCIFCNLITANDPNIILEPRSDQFVIIKDIKPVATYHFLVLSDKHIKSAKSLQPNEQDCNLLKSMVAAAKQILLNNGCDLNDTRMGFHWPPFYSIGHMHLHVISPVSSMSAFNRFVAFNPSFSYVFVDVDYVLKRIGCKEKNEIENTSSVTQSKL